MSISPLRRCLPLLLLATGACLAFTGCVDDERHYHHRRVYHDYDRGDRRDYRGRDSYYEDGPRRVDPYRRSSATVYGGNETSVTIQRDTPRRAYYY